MVAETIRETSILDDYDFVILSFHVFFSQLDKSINKENDSDKKI
jgi:hypothetical protein